ncbi:MAG: PAS domain S-box protein [Deltaproteobacteria bacterium]|nr:PAS domain S-box protein [Deltaproteobacteria bacterium]
MTPHSPCWEHFGCDQKDCPVRIFKETACWTVPAVNCQGNHLESFPEKMKKCLDCSYFQQIKTPKILEAMLTQLVNLHTETVKMALEMNRGQEHTSTEMAIGLSEVFEALRKIASGDPSVRISEDSSLGLITHLKELVNLTARNMGEIVDLSHEFAIGLSEHFDVLHRVSRGDLSARITGTSPVELLESLKHVTNDMIQNVSRQIADRKKAEEEAQESERLISTLMKNLPGMVYRCRNDRNWTMTFVSDGSVSLTGYAPQDLIGNRILSYNDLIHPDDREMVWKQVQEAVSEHRPYQLQYRIENAIGNEKWVWEQGTGVYSDEGELLALEGFVNDITERKTAEVLVKASEAKYRALVNNIQDGVFILQDNKLRFVNEALAHMMGYSVEEMTDLEFLPLVAPEYRQLTADRYRRRQAGETIDSEYEFDILHKDGSTRLTVNMNIGSFSFRGKTANLGTIKDITDKKRAEQDRQKLENQLQQAHKMEAVGTLAGGIAHDFNNLLMGILGNATLTLMNMDPSHPGYDRLKNIEKYVQSGADLTRQLLGFARGGKFEVKPTNLNELIQRTSEMFGRTKKEITISLRLQKDIWTVDVDRSQIEQVLLNFYVNAWQAMPAGGNLHLQTANEILDTSYIQAFSVIPGNYVRFSITDTGVGMDSHTQKRVFEPFFTTKEKGRGTGLGLASAYGIIKNHGGFINVYSEKGRGTSFTVYLPASKKSVCAEKDIREPVVKGSGTVLLVDDEQMILDVGGQMLEKLGYQVLTAPNGKEAITLFERHRDDIVLVILDMIMPVLGGSETFDKLKSMHPSLKVLLSSGYAVDGQASDILKRGCNGFIQKPFNLEQLSQKTSEVLLLNTMNCNSLI